jgi:predicted RNase H-like HicB family nuclease
MHAGSLRNVRPAGGLGTRILLSLRGNEIFTMRNFTAVIERDADTGMYVAWVPGFPGAHSQGETLDELRSNLQEVLEMLLEDGDPRLESDFIGLQTVQVA